MVAKLLIALPQGLSDADRMEQEKYLNMVLTVAGARRGNPIPVERNKFKLNGQKFTLVTAFCDSVQDAKILRRSVTDWMDVQVSIDQEPEAEPCNQPVPQPV